MGVCGSTWATHPGRHHLRAAQRGPPARGGRRRRGGGERGNARPAAHRRTLGRSGGHSRRQSPIPGHAGRGDGPRRGAGPRPRGGAGRRFRAPQRARLVPSRAMAGRRGPACGGNRRDLHRQCRAPGFPGRRGGEDHRRRAWAECARLGRPRSGRGRAGGRGARGLAGAAGPRPHLPSRPGGGGAGWLVPDGEPVGAARACPAVAGRRAGGGGPATRGGTFPVAAIPAAVRSGSGWWSRSAAARRARL